MEPATVSSCILTLHRRFAAYTTQRLQELGLIPGTAVACCWKRPRGGPAAYRFRGTTIALRVYDSRGVLVERC